MVRLAVVAALLLLAGCTRTHTVPEPDGGVVRFDGGTGTDAGPSRRDSGGIPPKCATPAPVDVLFVIDNSSSMGEEQEALARELPAFVTALIDPADRDGDGEPDWEPVPDLHLGVITVDMGTGGYTVPTCTEPMFGDDGILRTDGNTAISGCMATYPAFLTARAGESDPATVAADFRCVAQMGTGGCGFEQQLEAMLKALTPSTSSVRFFDGTTGHADGANAGFLREDSHLAVVVLTDEEDCSASDTELFDITSPRFTENLNLRCFEHPEALHPVERFVEGLLALRSDQPNLLSYSLIAGVPRDLVLEGASYDEMLADERMQETIDPRDPNRLVPSCNEPGRGLAFPPRRMVRVAQGLESAGAVTTVQSICQRDYSEAVRVIGERIGRNACEMFLE